MKIKKANRFVFFLLRLFFRPYLRLKYRFHFDRASSKKIKGPCIILSNHQMAADQFIVGTGFRFPINFVASDYIMRRGIGSFFIRLLARPIPIVKGSSDFTAIKNMLSVLKQGGAVAMFPEGNRTFFGETSYFRPSVAKLAKKAKVPLVLVNIKGGFLTVPRWGNGVRKGKVEAGVVKVLSPSELSDMNEEQINSVITDSLYVNDFDFARERDIKLKGKTRAEHIEAVLFSCPSCGDFQGLKSQKNRLYCTKCGMETVYGEQGQFEGAQDGNIPASPLEWSRMQLQMLTARDYTENAQRAVFSDGNIGLYLVRRAESESLLGMGELKAFSDRFEFLEHVFPFAEIEGLGIQGAKVLQLYLSGGKYYMLRAEKGTNLVKYMMLYYHLKEKREGEKEDYYGY